MKLFSLFILATILSCVTSIHLKAQDKTPDWENPEIFAVNTEKTRATAIPYADEQSAIADEYGRSPYYQCLNGIWKFHWVPKVNEVPAGFFNENYDDSSWDKMPVPGNWEFNGFGIPYYVNIGYGFPVNPPRIDRNDSPVGAYRQTFDIPETWDERRVFLHFEGGTNFMYVYVNGKQVGINKNTKSPAEFDITPYIRPGKNLLACQVHKFSDGSYLEDQDMWRLGGINRSVYLYSTADTRIQDFFTHPDLDKNYRHGEFSMEVALKNYSGQAQKRKLEVSILDKNGKSVFRQAKNTTIGASSSEEITVTGKVSNPSKWTAETPNLYTLLLTLKDKRGNLIESTSSRIGFRKVEIKDGQLLVNGQKVYLKGVNLHEFNTHKGQVVDKEIMMRNLQLMKELNINAVRTSHYPQQPLWYKLCDEYGMYLVDEANLESHGLGYGPDNVSNFPEWHGQHMDRMYRLVERDKNHPSVIIWSLGNEASNGKAFFDMYDWAKQRDPSRPVQYEQAGRNRNTDIICPMYPSWESMKHDAAQDLGRPYIMCEYAHAMGNSMGNFPEYWELMRSSKNMQGGFIWEWYNHGYATKDEQGRSYWAYGGDLGGYNKMNDENFCMDGLITPDQQYMPHTHIVKKVYQNILFEAKELSKGVVTVINDFKFINLTNDAFGYRWVLLKNGEKIAEGDFSVEVPANSSKDVQLQLPSIQPENGIEYFLHLFAYDKKGNEFIDPGFEVAKEEFTFESNHYFAQIERSGTLKVQKDENITVTSGNKEYVFSIKDGRTLISAKVDGKNIFKELPRLNFWRAPVDNDFGSWEQYALRLWEAAGHNVIYHYLKIEPHEGDVSFMYRAKLRGIEAFVDITYTVNKDGSLTTDYHYQGQGDDLPEMMRFGVLIVLPEEYNRFQWYGRGPWENYIDRNTDTFMGIWGGFVEDQTYPYYRPQETGNKTDVRWLTLQNEAGKGIKVDGAQPLSVSATRFRPEDLDPGMTKKQQHWSDVRPRKETVLCVDLFQRGVGGLNSWGARPLNEYRFSDKEYRYSFTISTDNL
ncbi:glycoside hydrolase family 2 TIM barrel-domain containing protein [Proteiniphilum sp.]|uniref:glycoside hydrolase family 2 TIM barrel-domain containing protein n=1 Tax=Proteiniphilum sp. TaxID=1926877 RepID=UPI002B2020F8|nr:glycoside hydrolase family 2 TIM barrel-domain containing protein [Proteiniphilum sp.]MEA4918090.1 glycoside hydrolase family 2 TIM barrel-domain containing protein [Proteiniphilum sp.]